MSDYTKATNFAVKDTLASGNPAKIIKGAEIDAEFVLVRTAVNSKADSASPTFTGTTTMDTLNVTNTLTAGTIDGGTY